MTWAFFFFFFEWFGSCTKHSVWQDTWWCCFYWFLQMFLMEIPQHAMFLCCLTLKYSNIVWFGVICSNDDQNTYIIYLINFFWVGGYDNVQNEVTEICQLFGQSISAFNISGCFRPLWEMLQINEQDFLTGNTGFTWILQLSTLICQVFNKPD